jgi:hypothetical protein
VGIIPDWSRMDIDMLLLETSRNCLGISAELSPMDIHEHFAVLMLKDHLEIISFLWVIDV